MVQDIPLADIADRIIAVGALGTAAFGLVDGSKAFRGGISNAGFRFIRGALTPFETALDVALGNNVPGCDWKSVMRAHWINGRPKEEQKGIAVSLIQLGLTDATAAAVAVGGNVDPAALAALVTKLNTGVTLSETDLNLMGRLRATIEARVDAAYDRAEQVYRNWARAAAGLVAIALAVVADYLFLDTKGAGGAIFLGLVAVPLAPIAKDLASALTRAVGALGGKAA